MIIETAKFKEVCSTILGAIDNSELSTLTEALELKTEGKSLLLNVTNGEYFLSSKFELGVEESFIASVNANLFLKLIAAVTTEDIEMEVKDTYVQIKANGIYKIPLIFDGNSILKLPEIHINNKTVEMKISGSILKSILNYNSKELLRGTISKPVQKMYYIDEKGCITFTSGACVNSFTLEKPIRILLNDRLVKLFKLFKEDMVDFTLGYDPISNDLIQTKVSFMTNNITLIAITGCNDELINSVPVASIRGRAFEEYPYNIVFNKKELEDSISRLLLFSAGYGSIKNTKPYSHFHFEGNTVTIYDTNEENQELIRFKDDINITDSYDMRLDLNDLKTILNSIPDEYITLSFGNHTAIVIKRKSIFNIVPEIAKAGV